MADPIRLHIMVQGVVQGVGYRFFARHEALQLGLLGWVRNREDGAVEMVVEGDSGIVRDFVKQLHIGPPLASVKTVQVEDVDALAPLDLFEVRF